MANYDRTASGLPDYNYALGDFLRPPPDPLNRYENVVTQVYPLRAQKKVLQEFCDKYLNLEPREGEERLMEFEVAAPWVLMQVCDYGKLGYVTPNGPWFAEHELAFGIPLKWYERNGEERKFQDLAIVYPFIFVDSPLGMAGGRQIYGWSKAGIEFECTPPELKPAEPALLVNLRRARYSHPSPFELVQWKPREKGEYETLLQIFRQRPFLSGSSGIENLLTAVPRAIGGYFSAASGILETIGQYVSGYESKGYGAVAGDIQSLGEFMLRWYGYANKTAPSLYRTILRISEEGAKGAKVEYSLNNTTRIATLKQFPDAENLNAACYQAIVISEMNMEPIDGGLLFDPLSADPTGGIQIKLLSSEEQEILTELGIQPSASTVIDDIPGEGKPGKGKPGELLLPVIPFWAKMNLSYGDVPSQAWRSSVTMWSRDYPLGQPQLRQPVPVPYVPYGSGAGLALQTPREYHNAILRVFAIPADAGALQDLVDRYLNVLDSGYYFTVKTSAADRTKSFLHVMLLDYQSIITADRALVPFGDTILTFYVPVERSPGEQNASSSPAMIPLYNFVGMDWNFITDYEVYGTLTFKSAFISPEDTWLRQSDPTSIGLHDVLEIRTTVFPDDPAEPAGEKPVIIIRSGPGPSLPPAKRVAIDTDFFKALGLEGYLASTATQDVLDFEMISLKQVRDAKDPSKAPYQSLVSVKRSHTLDKDIVLLPAIEFQLNEYTNLSIFERMGIGGIVDGSITLSPSKSASLPGRMRDYEVSNLTQRIGTGPWR
jgi:hypothetical protein